MNGEYISLEKTYTWSPDYILPFETMYGIMEKFCFLNAVNSGIFFKLRSTSLFQTIRNRIQESEKFLDRFIIPYVTQLKYCPQCMKYGYHSYFHQFVTSEKCFLHPDQKLQRNNHVNPFEISNTVMKSQLLSYAKSVSVENIIHPSDLLEKLDLFCLKLMNSKLEFIYVLRTVDHQKVYSFTKNALNEYATSEMISKAENIKLLITIKDCDLQRRDSDLLVECARKIICHWRERNQYWNHRTGLKEHINNFLFSHYRLTDKGNYVTFSKEPLPILFHALTIDIINKYFNGDTKFYYKLADELRQSFMQRNTCYIEQYSALVILFALLNVDRPDIYTKMIHTWPKVWGAVANKFDLVDALWSLNYERVLQKYVIEQNEFTLFKFLMLQDTFKCAKDSLAASFQTGQFDIKLENILQIDLKLMIPQYLLIKSEDEWKLYSCRPV